MMGGLVCNGVGISRWASAGPRFFHDSKTDAPSDSMRNIHHPLGVLRVLGLTLAKGHTYSSSSVGHRTCMSCDLLLGGKADCEFLLLRLLLRSELFVRFDGCLRC